MERYREEWGCWWKQYVNYLSALPSPAYQPQILFRVPVNFPANFTSSFNSVGNTGQCCQLYKYLALLTLSLSSLNGFLRQFHVVPAINIHVHHIYLLQPESFFILVTGYKYKMASIKRRIAAEIIDFQILMFVKYILFTMLG